MIHTDVPRASTSASGADVALETFERAPAPSSGPTPGVQGSGPTAGPSSRLAFPPGRNEEAEKEREHRLLDLDGDEELARQLAAQLRLTSPAEHDTGSSEDRLPRVGDNRASAPRPDDSERDRHGSVDDTNYGVEYHALASDGEEEGFPDPPRAGVAGYAPLICSVLTNSFRAAVHGVLNASTGGQSLRSSRSFP
mmetsp:Transcript_82949/g.230403  ORF Transcript_82949/g.230403 Transcript_82949/m.230403 type:complete len:195 (-) Transcript_82949:262-846(-)